tara:strand:- start:49 stop:297 length:249 start_codon:yes stop_codon:yes gene_type:complete
MSDNKEELKNKIIYRASYRGSKEMDILMSNFVKSIINHLDLNQLKELDYLVNLDDEELMNIKNSNTDKNLSSIKLFKDFQNF